MKREKDLWIVTGNLLSFSSLFFFFNSEMSTRIDSSWLFVAWNRIRIFSWRYSLTCSWSATKVRKVGALAGLINLLGAIMALTVNVLLSDRERGWQAASCFILERSNGEHVCSRRLHCSCSNRIPNVYPVRHVFMHSFKFMYVQIYVSVLIGVLSLGALWVLWIFVQICIGECNAVVFMMR